MTAVSVVVQRNAAGRTDCIVTTPTGYRAVLPMCDRDDCRDGTIRECRRRLDSRWQHDLPIKDRRSRGYDAWAKHARTHCHDWHAGRVEDFAAAVARTYGSARRLRALDTLKARSVPRLSVDVVAEMLDITPDEYRAELAKAWQ